MILNILGQNLLASHIYKQYDRIIDISITKNERRATFRIKLKTCVSAQNTKLSNYVTF